MNPTVTERMKNVRTYAANCLKEEAQAIMGLIPLLDDNFDKAVEMMYSCQGKLIITGVGKSGHIGAKIAATLSSTGTPSFFLNPLDAYHGDLGVVTSQDIVVAISNSGQTDELLRFVPMLIHMGIPIIGMSGNPKSLLAKYSNVHINVAVEREACPLNLAPTSSTTAVLSMGDALAVALMVVRNFKPKDFAQFHPGGELGKRLLTTAADVITDGDIRRAMEKWQAQFFDKTVSDIMTRSPKIVSTQTKISEIQHIMNKYKIHSVLVADNDRHLLGIVDHYRCMV